MNVSIVIPVFCEEQNLGPLWERLEPVCRELGDQTEVVLVDDGSRDDSLRVLRELAEKHPDLIRVVSFNRNYGQHAAVMAGLEHATGDVVVTLDADLQNRPEDIPKLLAKVDEGFDVVGGWREKRKDTAFRRWASRLNNRITARLLGVDLRDYGCMLRAYKRNVVDAMVLCPERSTFVPALACKLGRRTAEVAVGHDDRQEGDPSRYSFWQLLKLQADLMTGFSSAPLRLAAFFGATVSVLSVAFGIFLGIRRLIIGPENEGVFTLFAILFFLMGANFFALGIVGEYVGRIYTEVRGRPRSIVQERINVGPPGDPLSRVKGPSA